MRLEADQRVVKVGHVSVLTHFVNHLLLLINAFFLNFLDSGFLLLLCGVFFLSCSLFNVRFPQGLVAGSPPCVLCNSTHDWLQWLLTYSDFNFVSAAQTLPGSRSIQLLIPISWKL